MGGSILTLDTILSATFHFVRKWSPDLSRSASRDLLRFVVIRLYDQERGKLLTAQLAVSQGTLGRKLGLSRQWVGILLARLQAAGWVEYYAPVLEDGMHGSTVVRIGRQLRRLLVMLSKSKRGEKPVKPAANSRWHFSPSKREKEHLLILKKEREPLRPALLDKIPLLRTWLKRGET